MSQTYTWPAVVSSAPPVGGATAANQVLEIAQLTAINANTDTLEALATAGNASLSSIDGKLTAPLAVTGPLTDAQLRATPVPVSAASLPLPTGAATEATLSAFSNKSAGALVPEAFDYQDITYVGASTDVDQVIYKSGGAGGTVVATLTMGYDGSNRLTSVTKT